MQYVIWAPNYSKSAGVRALYKLSKMLEARGVEAPILCGEKYEEYHCITDFTRKMQENDIIIYPEIVKGNPLLFHRVVRYVLYYPGVNGGDTKYDTSDYVITWDSCYIDKVPVLYLPLMDEKIFCDEHLPKTQNCFFVYKGGMCRKIPELETAVRITMDYPKEREELARLLKTTNILYSYDPYSMLNDEALACGAKVKIVTKNGVEDYFQTQKFNPTLLEKQIDEFILATQKLKATKPKSPHTWKRRLFYRCKLAQYNILSRIWKKERAIQRVKHYRFQLGIPGKLG